MVFFNLLLFSISVFYSPNLWSQSLVEDVGTNEGPTSQNVSTNVFTETIKIISNSKKIFILTNKNDLLGIGDFISLALEDKLAARAVVGKTHQGNVGIKILKIYSLAQWGKLKKNQEVQIIRGDDSGFGKKEEIEKPETVTESKIKTEEDLYTKDVVIEEDIGEFEDKKTRHIKPDNVVAINGSFFNAPEVESRGGTARANEIGLSWAYQFSDNYFFEAAYGRILLDNYPGDGSQTLVNHLTGRLKLNIKGPLYTFIMPYLGYHSYSVSSPDAGKSSNLSTNEEELNVIDDLKKSGPIFGITILRRLVPGWFVKTDIGTDVINLGFAIEF